MSVNRHAVIQLHRSNIKCRCGSDMYHTHKDRETGKYLVMCEIGETCPIVRLSRQQFLAGLPEGNV